jgi:hypothetical protein
VVKRLVAIALLVLGAGCDAGFEKQSIVIDLRVLAMRTDPAEVVVDVDPNDIAQVVLPPVTLTALVADPLGPRQVTYTMTACGEHFELRCDDPEVAYKLPMAEGTVDGSEPQGILQADFALLQAALEEDEFRGLGGIPVVIELVLRASDGEEVHAAKRIFYSQRIPERRVPNTNPFIGELRARGSPFAADPPLVVGPGETLELEPVETPGVRETYVTPTIDGGERTFTENLRYSWLATRGEFSDEMTGGAIDFFGNKPVLKTKWTAPDERGEVSFWLVQRDERGGTSWITRRILVQ